MEEDGKILINYEYGEKEKRYEDGRIQSPTTAFEGKGSQESGMVPRG